MADQSINNLEGDSLLGSTLVTYLAPFTQKVREKLYQKWLRKIAANDIKVTQHLNFNAEFCDSLEIKQWLENGLPNDSFSI